MASAALLRLLLMLVALISVSIPGRARNLSDEIVLPRLASAVEIHGKLADVAWRIAALRRGQLYRRFVLFARR